MAKGAGNESDRNRARHYLDRAEECRSQAAEMKDAGAREALVQVAQSYEAMAHRIEEKLASKPPPRSE